MDEVVADGVQDKLADGVNIELAHQVRAMSFSGFDAQAERDGDLLGALAFGE